MTVRLVAFAGLLGIGLAGCSNPGTPPPAQTPDVAPPSAGTDAGSQAAQEPAPPPQDNDTAPAAPAPVRTAAPRSPSNSTQPANPPVQQGADNGQPPASANDTPDEGSQSVNVVVATAPPPPMANVPPPPRPGYEWTPGYWSWNVHAQRHIWVRGSYVPMRQGSSWVPASWVHVARGWQFRPGHWQGGGVGPAGRWPPSGQPPGRQPPPRWQPPPVGHQPPPAGGGAMPAPPPPKIEPIVQRPGFVYATGYWRWNGNAYAWVAGDYVRNRPGSHWVQPHWTRGPGGAWHFQQGHWESQGR